MIRRLALAGLIALFPAVAFAQFATIGPTPAVTDNGDRLATTAWVNNFFNLGIPLASGKIFIGSAGGIATAQTMSGDCTLAATGVITCTQSAGNFLVNGSLTVSGSVIDGNGILATNIAAPATPAAGTTRVYVDLTQKVLTSKNDAGVVANAVVPSTCSTNQFGVSISAAGVFGCAQPAVANISGFGTGIATALGVNVGSAGAPVLFNGAGGTPTSLTLTNGTGLPISGITGLGTGVGAALAVNTGTAGSHVVNGGAGGTPSSITLTNGTGLPASGLTGTIGTGSNIGLTAGIASWTPAIAASGTAGTPAYSAQVGSIYRDGNSVTVWFDVQVSGWTGTPTGNITITGLPVAAGSTANDFGDCTVHTYVLAASVSAVNGRIAAGTAVISMQIVIAGGAVNTGTLTTTQAGTTPILVGSCRYHT